jgi:putative DNA primase/helicase
MGRYRSTPANLRQPGRAMNAGAIADVLNAHPELIATRRAIAHAPDKLRQLESEALRLSPLIERNEIGHGEAAACLIDVMIAHGLCATARERKTVEHVVGEGLAGRSAGVGLAPAVVNDTARQRLEPLRPLNLAAFLEMKLPPRRLMLAPWLSEKAIVMVYSPRGVGKTLLALSVGYAVASGSAFLQWTAAAPRRVLYVDGEMPAGEMQHRLAAIVAGVEAEAVADYFRMLSADASADGLPDLATREGQRALDEAIGDAELIVLDNISTLVRAGKENEAESWATVQDWALAHRRAGRSMLFVHHAGKGGGQRGTSKREDVLDTVIALRRPPDYRADQGARFEVHFEKARGFHGADAQPFEARYEVRDGAAMWTRTAITDAELRRVADVIGGGLSVREVGKMLEMPKSKVQRLKERAEKQGLLNAVSRCPAD